MTWVVAKIKRNQESIFKKSLEDKFSNSFELFYPKVLSGRASKYVNLLGEYVFLNIKNNFKISKEKYIKGLKYFLSHYEFEQGNIELFIKKCKENSKNNIIDLSFFNKLKFNKIQFKYGPFKNFLFNIIWKNKKIFAINKNISIKITEENIKNFIFI